MNETERQALAERIGRGTGLLDENHMLRIAYTVVVRNVIDELDEEGLLCEPPKTAVALSDLWANVSVSSDDIARLADEVETWPSVMNALSNPLGPEKIWAIREVRTVVSTVRGFTPPLVMAKNVVDNICTRHGWSYSAWQGKS
jgi:hypothetical protein